MIGDLNAEALAAWVAAVAAVLAVGAALFVHWDTRGRVRTDLRLTWWAPGMGVTASSVNFHREVYQGPAMEFALVGLENPGRNAVTITDLGLELRRHGGRRDATTPMHFISDEDQFHEGHPRVLRRLEPNDRHAVIFDLWEQLDEEFRQDPNLEAVTVRGCARIAGQRRLKRSRTHWTIWRDTVSALPDQRLRPLDMIILSALLRGRRRLEREPLALSEYERLHNFVHWVGRHVVTTPGDWFTLASLLEHELADFYSVPGETRDPKDFRPWAKRTARDITHQLERLGTRAVIPSHLQDPSDP